MLSFYEFTDILGNMTGGLLSVGPEDLVGAVDDLKDMTVHTGALSRIATANLNDRVHGVNQMDEYISKNSESLKGITNPLTGKNFHDELTAGLNTARDSLHAGDYYNHVWKHHAVPTALAHGALGAAGVYGVKKLYDRFKK